MSTKAKKLVSICTLCALLLCMVIPTAFAAQVSSTATVDYGSSKAVDGGARTLLALPLSGAVNATGSSTNGSVTGKIWTKGMAISTRRATAKTEGATVKYMSWNNPDSETGTFWAWCQSPAGNQAGYCTVWQNQ